MKIDSEQEQNGLQANRAALLGKWLWMLFWLVVPATIAGIMKNDRIMNLSRGIYLAGQVMNAACSIAYGAILLKLSVAEDRYRTAGICSFITAGVSILIVAAFGGSKAPAWTLIITLPAAIAGWVREYNECRAHSSVLVGTDHALVEKWTALWTWYTLCMLGIIGSALLILISLLLGAILLIGAEIGMIIVGITKLVCLYRTAKVFRELPAEACGP